MSKKTFEDKLKLGKHLKKARRIPLLAVLRTHKGIEYNQFTRNWRHTKIKNKK
ncbi:MAG: 50S ribosomal protein L39e [Candidatus Marsarchaeota archaeon]|jgi:ribosomal protein L39E|nr:50S ribosomal protein L39e [Candidatus Marsarchaeota archaeon]MCL5434606.1 50S ribosomal protein L39e [Candidatus Marsarchaeota archaeon]MCW6161053.1 hypothetical protein [Candidatus Micrarchaeales archaeon]